MTAHLYVLTLGPIQGFIAAARTTRDLWIGSHMLSEISKAAAESIAHDGGELIFPALTSDADELKPRDTPDAFNVANIILAKLPEKILPETIDGNAKKAARGRWREFANPARDLAKGVIDESLWNEQIDDVIEFYSAWVQYPDPDDYSRQRDNLMRLLAARKATRDFMQAKPHWGLEKSSLDGARDSIFKEDARLPNKLIIRLRLKEKERLCAVGLTKRLGNEAVHFPSVTRVAADPWIRRVMSRPDTAKILKEIAGICEEHPDIASRYTGKLYRDFPFDGQVLFPPRIDAMIRISKNRERQGKSWIGCLDDNDRDALAKIRSRLFRLQKKGHDHDGNPCYGLGEPNPYFAILVADGDQMGRSISSIETADRHQEFSRQLSGFAKEARRIIEGETGIPGGNEKEPRRAANGCLVYSGGDDVLAFLPLDSCLAVARELHDTFGELLEKFPTPSPENKKPTLSVGIAIVHALEPLEDILDYGREAGEKIAKKPDRNGLAICLHTRSGGETQVLREQWKEIIADLSLVGPGKVPGLDQRLEQWVRMYINDEFPDGAAYDLKELADDYRGWESKPPDTLLKSDMGRLFARKRAGHGTREISPDDLALLTCGVESHDHLIRRADELVISRRIAEVVCQTPREGGTEAKP
ncbi:MAG: type III-B CRISPR-associated protein Cas10/Cmr2 [Methanoregula sp.]|nr:type III-B CRISPR-associated protein Cas10/Cmr2 [Methanoregula sp.]